MLVALLRKIEKSGDVARHAMNILLVCVGLSVAFSAYVLVKQGDSAQVACRIQQRGLAANQHLTAFFVDWDRLITLQRKQEAKVLLKQPAAERRVTQAALNEIHAFAAIQSKQPNQRSCP